MRPDPPEGKQERGQYDERDSARETDVSIKEVRQAWHQAREDCQRDDRDDRVSRTSDWRRRQDDD